MTADPVEAAKGADVLYTDSWMSYHIPQHKQESRVKVFSPYQVNGKLMKRARKDAIFMNCLPAGVRGFEQNSKRSLTDRSRWCLTKLRTGCTRRKPSC